MSVEKFQDRDDDYVKWLEENPTGYVINVARMGHGDAMLHCASCRWITGRPPFTGPYIKICSTALGDLDQWALDRGTVGERCKKCQPSEHTAGSQPPALAKPASPAPASAAAKHHTTATGEWEIDGPDNGQRRVRLWVNSYIPFERLTSDHQAAREALRLAVRCLTAAPEEILHAGYAGPKPTTMDVENLVLYNIDATASGCFQPSTRHGVRFEIAAELHGDPPSGRPYARSYEYRLTSPDSSLSHWRRVRALAKFSEADLGEFKSTKRLEHVWSAIHQTHDDAVETASQSLAPTERFAVFLTLSYPGAKSVSANAELVKALIDGAVAAFQAHDHRESLDDIAARLARITGKPTELLKRMLLDDERAVLATGGASRLVYLRGTGLQWNPADHLCVAGQVVCRQGATWTLSGEIHTVEQVRQAESDRSTSARRSRA